MKTEAQNVTDVQNYGPAYTVFYSFPETFLSNLKKPLEGINIFLYEVFGNNSTNIRLSMASRHLRIEGWHPSSKSQAGVFRTAEG